MGVHHLARSTALTPLSRLSHKQKADHCKEPFNYVGRVAIDSITSRLRLPLIQRRN